MGGDFDERKCGVRWKKGVERGVRSEVEEA